MRPDSFNFPLLVHILGAMMLVGTVAAGVTVEIVAVRSHAPERWRRLAFRTFLLGAVPAYIVMRTGAEWMYSKEFPEGSGDDPAWIGIGYIAADGGAVLLVVALILAGVAARKPKPRLAQVAGLLAAVALVAWLVAVWAMAGKPG